MLFMPFFFVNNLFFFIQSRPEKEHWLNFLKLSDDMDL